MTGKKRVVYVSLSILIIVLSFVVYFGFSKIDKTYMENIAFGAFILTELIFFTMIYLVSKKETSLFVRAGNTSVSVIYLISSLIINVFLQSFFELANTLITTNVVLLIFYLAIVLLIYLFKKER